MKRILAFYVSREQITPNHHYPVQTEAGTVFIRSELSHESATLETAMDFAEPLEGEEFLNAVEL